MLFVILSYSNILSTEGKYLGIIDMIYSKLYNDNAGRIPRYIYILI